MRERYRTSYFTGSQPFQIRDPSWKVILSFTVATTRKKKKKGSKIETDFSLKLHRVRNVQMVQGDRWRIL